MVKLSSIDEAVTSFEKYVDDLKSGRIKSINLGFPKLNNIMMKGLDWHTVWTIGAMSGAGKSAFSNQIETNVLTLNKDVAVLNFTLEMLPMKQVGRKVSSMVSKSTQDIYGGNTTLPDLSKLKTLDVTYAEGDFTVHTIIQTIEEFYDLKRAVNPNIGVLVIFDHMLLTDDKDEERLVIKNLAKAFASITNKIKCSVIALSQLNRDIESVERTMNPAGHFPMKKDLFGGDGIFQSSDYVSILHRPEKLNLHSYGPYHWPVEGMIYLHFLKVREGQECILQYENQLEFSRLIEL